MIAVPEVTAPEETVSVVAGVIKAAAGDRLAKHAKKTGASLKDQRKGKRLPRRPAEGDAVTIMS